MINRKRVLTYLVISLIGITILTACSLPSRQPDEPEVISLVGSAEVPTLDSDADRDPCLDGNWTMDTAELDLFVASLVPIPNIRVVGGSLNFIFADGIYNYTGDLTLQIELDMSEGKYMRSDANFSSGGPYATEVRSDTSGPVSSFLILDLTVAEQNILVWRAYKGGEVQTVPGTGPSFTILPPGDAPYKCTDSQLEIVTQGPGGPLSMFFGR